MNQHFTRGQGKYTCRRCKQATRDTGTGEAQHDLCKACYEIESYENEHSDDNHSGTIHDCKKCRKYMTPATIAKLDEENAAIKKAIPTTKLSRQQKSQAKAWTKKATQAEATQQSLTLHSETLDQLIKAYKHLSPAHNNEADPFTRAMTKASLSAINKAIETVEQNANKIFNQTPDGKARP